MQQAQQKVEALIEEVYAAGLGDQPWEQVLHGIRLLSGSRFVSMFSFDGSGLATLQRFAGDDPGSEARMANDYIADFHCHDPGRPLVAAWEAGRWYDDRQWVRSSERERSIFHQEYLRSYGFGRVEGTFLHRSADEGHFLSLLGACDRQHDLSFRASLAGLESHLARALRMQSRLAGLTSRVALCDAVFDALTMPLFLLDDQRRLLMTNAAGQRLMSGEPAVRFVNNRFQPPGSDASHWQAACERGMLVVRGSSSSGKPLILNLIPVPARTDLAKHWQRPLTLMMAAGPRSADEREQHLCLIYSLTQAEAQVCILICDGGLSPRDCSDVRGVAIGTIRSQIKAIYLKTGVVRMAELVRLVTSI